jgi:L-iditol 2-dehydrogenase
MEIPSKMKAAVLYGKEDVRIEEIPVPQITDDEVLVRIKTALTCGTDLKVYRRGYHARMIVPPAVFGHEFSGVVEQVGANVNNFKPGMRVVAANSAPCNECFYCKKGKPNLCENLIFINGAYAEYIKIPRQIVSQNLLILPENVSYRSAALVEPLACVVRGLEETGIKPRDVVAVLGTGPIAYMFIRLAKLLGAFVISLGRRDERLKIAQMLGADALINTTNVKNILDAVKYYTEGGRGVDVAIEAIGQAKLWETAIDMVRKGGIVNLFGGCATKTSINIDTEKLHYSELTIKASFHHTPNHIKRALDLIAEGNLDAEEFITGQEPLKNLPGILDEMVHKRNGFVKVAIIP